MWTYILASRMRGTLFVGVTSDLVRRVYEHRNDVIPGFTKRYRVHRLVNFEQHSTPKLAIRREKVLKHWPRASKIRLIEQNNPGWRDLYDVICA